MRLTRIYCNKAKQAHGRITLDKSRSRHLITALRTRLGAELIVFNGQGKSFTATLIDAHSSKAIIKLGELQPEIAPSSPRIMLIQGMARNDRMDWIIQKATELGVYRILPAFTDHGIVKLDNKRSQKKLVHWQEIAIAACEQSGRSTLPIVEAAQPLTHWLQSENVQQGFVFDIGEYPSLNEFKPPQEQVQLLIGSEGGLSEAELEMAVHYGMQKCRLGSQVLRTETAALAAISTVQALWGDFRSSPL